MYVHTYAWFHKVLQMLTVLLCVWVCVGACVCVCVQVGVGVFPTPSCEKLLLHVRKTILL